KSLSRGPQRVPSCCGLASCVARPRNPLEQVPQAPAARRVNHGDVTDSPGEMRAKIRVAVMVLAVRTVAHAVGQNGLEAVDIRAPTARLKPSSRQSRRKAHRFASAGEVGAPGGRCGDNRMRSSLPRGARALAGRALRTSAGTALVHKPASSQATSGG